MVRQRFLSVPDVSETRTAKHCIHISWFVQPWVIFRRLSHNTGEPWRDFLWLTWITRWFDLIKQHWNLVQPKDPPSWLTGLLGANRHRIVLSDLHPGAEPSTFDRETKHIRLHQLTSSYIKIIKIMKLSFSRRNINWEVDAVGTTRHLGMESWRQPEVVCKPTWNLFLFRNPTNCTYGDIDVICSYVIWRGLLKSLDTLGPLWIKVRRGWRWLRFSLLSCSGSSSWKWRRRVSSSPAKAHWIAWASQTHQTPKLCLALQGVKPAQVSRLKRQG